jgi:hypothetical protein
MRTLVLAIFVIAAAFAKGAHADGAQSETVQVGATLLVPLPPHPMHELRCDDLDVLHARLVNKKNALFLELVGQKVGTTTCAVRYVYYQSTIINIAVVAAP